MLLIRKSSHRNSNASSDDDIDAKKNNDLYQQCVDEIKKEHKILGSIELHQEAMRRLKLRQQSNNNDMSSNNIIKQRRPTLEEVYRPKGLSKSTPHLMSQFARSLGNIGDAIRRHSSMPANDSNNNIDNQEQQQQVMAGRRESAALPVGFDPGIISANVMQDLELSDSDSDDDNNDDELQLSKSNKRSSILRRSSSKLRGSISRMGSFRRMSSVSFGTNGGESSSSDGIIDEKMNEEEGGKEEYEDEKSIINNIPSDFPGVDMTKYTPKSTNKKDVSHREQRIGRRRSSLFSVDEKRASTTEGPPTTTCNSSSNNSIGNSITGSLQGSFSGGDIKKDDHDGSSLICSFGRTDSSFNSSDGSGDKLICDWHRRSSMLSDSEVSIDVNGITISDSAEEKE